MTSSDEEHGRLRPEPQAEASPTAGLELKPLPAPGPLGGLLDGLGLGAGGRNLLIGIGGAILLAAAAGGSGLLSLSGGNVGPGAAVPPSAAQGPSLFTPVPAAEIDKAVDLLMLADADKKKIRSELQRGAMRIALITVLDNDAEDGDWVTITGAGFRQDVRLFHKPYQVAVPYLPGQPVLVQGLKDGGGGDITVTVMMGAAKLSLKPIKEREMLQLVPP